MLGLLNLEMIFEEDIQSLGERLRQANRGAVELRHRIEYETRQIKLMKRIFGYTPSDRSDNNLFYIAELINGRPTKHGLGGLHLAELDQIADYQIPAEGEWPPLPCGMDPDDYGIGVAEIEDFLSSLEWWVHVAEWIPTADPGRDALLRAAFAAIAKRSTNQMGTTALWRFAHPSLHTAPLQVCRGSLAAGESSDVTDAGVGIPGCAIAHQYLYSRSPLKRDTQLCVGALRRPDFLFPDGGFCGGECWHPDYFLLGNDYRESNHLETNGGCPSRLIPA